MYGNEEFMQAHKFPDVHVEVIEHWSRNLVKEIKVQEIKKHAWRVETLKAMQRDVLVRYMIG